MTRIADKALKGNCKVRSDLGFFFESVDLSLMNILGPQVDSSYLLLEMVKIKRVHVRDVISVKKVVRHWGHFCCPLRILLTKSFLVKVTLKE